MAEPTTFDAPAKRNQRRNGKGDRRRELGPHSRLFGRGAIGDMDGNSAPAKFIRTVERAVLDHLGGPDRASLPQKLLAARIAKTAYRLELFDRKLDEDGLTDYDARIYGALHNSYRLMLREIGLKAIPPKPETPDEVMARIRAGREAAA
jgi:hypothetical protein